MFSLEQNLLFQYAPILALNPSEMTALEQLPEKDKDAILPMFPLKGWTTAHNLKSSIERINKSINGRKFIADIDSDFIFQNKKYIATHEYPRHVHEEIHLLLNSNNGYDNWVKFIQSTPNAIPTLQLDNLEQLDRQIISLANLNRGLVIRFKMQSSSATLFNTVARSLVGKNISQLLFIFDHEDVGRLDILEVGKHAQLIQSMHRLFPRAIFSISSASFPSSFAGSYRGEIPIYERLLFNGTYKNCTADITMLYSDRGGARAAKLSGGGSTPPPRIDYALKNDWRFIRKEFEDSQNIARGEKERLYKEAAIEMMHSDYWIKDLKLWGVQMIEKTSEGDTFGITSPNRATAVRINLHLYQQLHYNDVIEDLDTDEDWVD
ncbi:beta family protein [Shewanella sp. A14]